MVLDDYSPCVWCWTISVPVGLTVAVSVGLTVAVPAVLTVAVCVVLTVAVPVSGVNGCSPCGVNGCSIYAVCRKRPKHSSPTHQSSLSAHPDNAKYYTSCHYASAPVMPRPLEVSPPVLSGTPSGTVPVISCPLEVSPPAGTCLSGTASGAVGPCANRHVLPITNKPYC